MKETAKNTWVFSAVDTLFFRESRPMEAPGSSELDSLFPPPIRTVAGAIRSAIGEAMQVNWQEFKEHKEPEIEKIIGYGNDYGSLSLQGVWIHYKGQRLYPAPLNLMVKREDRNDREKITSITCLEIGSPCKCDLGSKVCLPNLPNDMHGSRPLPDHWLTKSGLTRVLTGETEKINPDKDIIARKDLLTTEHRLGIARDNAGRIAKDGMLYQTCHIRLAHHTGIGVDLAGYNGSVPAMVKLGSEGRVASLDTQKHPALPVMPANTDTESCQGIILYLLTPMLLPSDFCFLPGFTSVETEQLTYWRGELQGIPLKLISSVMGKTQREGGWDMAGHGPRAVQSLIPAGSVYYCRVEKGSISRAISSLHNSQIGLEKHLGRGHIAVGPWFGNREAQKQPSTKG